VLDGELRTQYRGQNFRPKVYGGWNKKSLEFAEDELLRLTRLKSFNPWASDPLAALHSLYVCPGTKKTKPHLADPNTDKGKPTLDHDIPVSEHWRTRGNNCRHDERARWYNDLLNLVLMCNSCNSAKGGESINYKVGPDFRGRGD
jgi:hypothetical protein